VALTDGTGAVGTKPRANDQAITFNGREPDDYETFHLSPLLRGFGTCKTGFERIRPYDLIVKSVLIAADDRAPGYWRISSDGFDFEWLRALAFAQEILGRSLELPKRVHDNATMKPEYRSGPRYAAARAAYLAANYRAGAGPDA